MNDQDHSQYGEAGMLIQYFQAHPPKHDFLVDVGAFGIDISNTFDLLTHGWGGLLIEAMPQEEFFRPLVETFQDNPKVAIIEGLAIGDYEGFGNAFLNKVPGQRSLLQALENDGMVQIPVRPLAPILQERGIPLDFDLLSVDAEGFDQRILECLLTHSAYRPRVIIFEKDAHFAIRPPEEQRAPWLEKRGYCFMFSTEGNLAYVRLGV
jgi:FkbM family methyltransferase